MGIIAAKPDTAQRILADPKDIIIGQALVGGKISEFFAIKPAYAIICCQPDKSLAVLDSAVNAVACKAILYSIMPRNPVLTMQKREPGK